ncbi:trigger factor [Allofranklinella schreckenbergeri]|uniref:Trigger factor n=1 Tax=Allofranklinella schreckenbergeri TaxID=1076744 RepID=A0A3M6QI18_9BURK|nr:trigger factor [Allofranklinella schreckenbergeri]RMX02733.1 trigger factor [Allofranklinella schreckenbergeri]
MTVNVEVLDKLERKITLSLPVQAIEQEVQARLKKLARNVKMDGFRPGKVPMSVVAQRYGASVHYEVLNDQVGQAFNKAVEEALLRVAGQPRISEKAGAAEGFVDFDAVFEVYPDVQIGDLSDLEIERVNVEVDEAAIERTLDILRKQRRTFAQRGKDDAVQTGDRVTVDFEGKIDGDAFAGGQAEDFAFLVGEGHMLKEFEDAVLGMKVGESKTFPLAFPQDYHGTEVAGKTADFLVTIKKVEAATLPEVTDEFAKSLGVQAATVDGLREDIRKNLAREVKFRVQARNKQAVLDALLTKAEMDLPTAAVQGEIARLEQGMREDLRQRGYKDIDQQTIPADVFRPQAERRVRLGLVVAELVGANGLEATPEQLRAHVEELAASYEKPEEVVRWYFGDRQRLGEIEAVVIENNVTEFVLKQAKTVDKTISFEELMNPTPAQEAQAEQEQAEA